MKLHPERRLPFLLLVFLGSTAMASNMLEIEGAWIAEAPPVSKVLAAYMEIENETRHDRQAVAMQCADFERAEFHRTVDQDGMARMQHQPTLRIKAGSKLTLKPGGYHIMLFEPARRMRAGDVARCSMAFDDGTDVEFDLTVRKASVEDHSHHHHH